MAKEKMMSVLRMAGATVFVAVVLGALGVIACTAPTWQSGVLWLLGLFLAAGAVGGVYLYAQGATGDEKVPATVIFDIVAATLGGLVVASFWNPIDPKKWAAVVMWSIACLALGGLTGFLFGIPRSRPVVTVAGAGPQKGADTPGSPPQEAWFSSPPLSSSPQENPAGAGAKEGAAMTQPHQDLPPIEQMADWVTKIMVGLGLANLRDMPGLLHQWASYISQSIGASPATPAADPSFALGLILYFDILGFVSGYLLTQMFLGKFINAFR